MKITEFSPTDFNQLESAWKLLEKGSEMTWFQTFDWYKTVNEHFMAEKKKAPFRKGTYILLSDDNGTPLMIAPIQIVKTGFFFKGIGLKKGFYFIGRQGFSDYLNFIYNNFKEEYLTEVLNYLKETYSLNYFCFENISSRCESYRFLEKVENVVKVDSLCMSLELLDSYDEYKKKWSKNMRGGMNQANNRSIKDNLEFEYEILTEIDSDLVEKLKSIREQRLGKKQKEARDSMSLYAKIYSSCRSMLLKITEKPIDVMAEIQNCWCLVSKCNNDIAAFYYCVYKPENKTVYFLLAGVDLKYERYKPGLTQLAKFLEKEMNNNRPSVNYFDLTRGNERYKYDLKADELITSQFSFYL